MQHVKNIRISSQQHQTSKLGLVEEDPSRGDMLLAEHAVLTHAQGTFTMDAKSCNA